MNGKTKWIAALCLLPFIVLFGAFQIAPLVWIAVHSFFSESSGWGWGNYVDILTSPFYLQAFQFSLEISLWSSVYGLLIALVGSYSLRQLGQTRFHDFVMSFTNMTSNFAGVPLAFAFVILLGLNGCLTLLLRKYGLMESFNLYSKSGLIVLYTYFQIPLGGAVAVSGVRRAARRLARVGGAARRRPLALLAAYRPAGAGAGADGHLRHSAG